MLCFCFTCKKLDRFLRTMVSMTSDLFLFVSAVLVLWLTTKLIAWYRKVQLLNLIDGPNEHPLLGCLMEILVPPEDRLPLILRYCPTSRGITRVWLTKLYPYVILYRASAVETVLSSQKILTKSDDYNFLLPWLGRGLLTSTANKWFGRRKMLTPAFHFKILEDFLEVFNVKAGVLVERLAEKTDGRVYDIFNTITLCALDIIIETAMGLDLKVQVNSDSPYVRAVKRVSGIIQERQMQLWFRPDWLFHLLGPGREHDKCLRVLHNVSMSTIRKRREVFRQRRREEQGNTEDRMEGEKKRLPFLDLLLQYSEVETEEGAAPLTDQDIREEVDTFMFEGHDTTATAINMTLFLLGWHPDIQEEVYTEIAQVWKDHDVTSSTGTRRRSPLTSAQLQDMRLLERCIKEALRLYPSVPIMGRLATSDITIEGKVVPAGTQVLVFPYQLHRDPNQFPDPERFDPDRFLPEAVSDRHPYAYVPFSAGPRNCIGQKFALMEAKVVLATVLSSYRLESVDTHDELKLLGQLITRPKNGIRVKMWHRNKA